MESPQNINFDQPIEKILQDHSIIADIKANSHLFTKKLSEDKELLHGLLDVGLCPRQFEMDRNMPITKEMTNRASEILTNLYDQFYQLLIYDKLLPKEEVSNFQVKIANEEQVVTSQIQPNHQYINLKHLHKFFTTPPNQDGDETACGYLNKIVSPLFYQKSNEIMKFYLQNGDVIDCMGEKSNLKGSMELFCKLIEIEDNKQFYVESKVNILQRWFGKILDKAENVNEISVFYIQALTSFFSLMCQKLQDRYQCSKYISLMEQLNPALLDIAQFSLKASNTASPEIIYTINLLLVQLLKLDQIIISQKTKATTPMTRRYSYSSAFYEQESQAKIQYHLPISFLEQIYFKIKQNMQLYFLHSEGKVEENTNLTVKGPHFSTFYKLLSLYAKLLKVANQNLLLKFYNEFFSEQFVNLTIEIVKKYPLNNILHNVIKQNILEWINHENRAIYILLNPANNVRKQFQKSHGQKLSKNIFENQMIHIFERVFSFKDVLEKYNIKEDQLEAKIAKKTLQYAAPICYDPRKKKLSSSYDSQPKMSQKNIEKKISEESSDNIQNIQIYSPYSNSAQPSPTVDEFEKNFTNSIKDWKIVSEPVVNEPEVMEVEEPQIQIDSKENI